MADIIKNVTIKFGADTAGLAGADGLFDKVNKKVGETEGSVVSLKSQLSKLKNELGNATDPKDVERLARAAGEVANKIQDAAKAAQIFATDSKFEQIGNSLKGIAGNLASLNFRQAADQSKLLLSSVKSLSFKDAISGLKDMGVTFLNIGKSLLVNPIFLVAAAVAAIGVAVFELKNKVPLLTKAFDFVSESVSKIKKFVTDITDALGFTTVASDKAFDRLIQLGKEVDEQRERRRKFLQEEKERQEKIAQEIKDREDKNRKEKEDSERAAYDAQLQKVKEFKDKEAKIKADADAKAQKDKEDAEKEAEKKKEELAKLKEEAYNAKREKDAEEFQAQLDKEIEDKKRQDELEIELATTTVNALFDLRTQRAQADLAQQQLDADKEKQINIDKVKVGLLTAEEAAAQNKLIDDRVTAERNKVAVEQAKRDKEQALFNLAINTIVSASKAGFITPVGLLITALGAIQAAAIIARPLPKFAEGVIDLKGKGTGTSDSIHAMLSRGESVMTADETQKHKALLTSIRNDKLDAYLAEKYVNPMVNMKLKDIGLANNMAQSIKLQTDFPDEYALSRVMRRNKEVELGNADYLAQRIASEINKSSVKRTWN
jgi:hypothetical protein